MAEAHDLEACNLQLFCLEQSWEFLDTNFMPKYGQNKIKAACAGKCTSYFTSK